MTSVLSLSDNVGEIGNFRSEESRNLFLFLKIGYILHFMVLVSVAYQYTVDRAHEISIWVVS